MDDSIPIDLTELYVRLIGAVREDIGSSGVKRVSELSDEAFERARPLTDEFGDDLLPKALFCVRLGLGTIMAGVELLERRQFREEIRHIEEGEQ